MTNPHKQPTVFISYSRRNQYVAERLRLDLERFGCNVWFDQRSIPIDSRWLEEIDRGIAAQDYFIYLWSPEAAQSEFVQHEYQKARELGKQICIAPVTKDFSGMSDDLRSFQHMDKMPYYEEGVRQILNWLGRPHDSASTTEALLNQNVTANFAAETLGETTQWQVNGKLHGNRIFRKIPYMPRAYATSYLVLEATAGLKLGDDVHVVFKFSGDEYRKTVQEVLAYLVGNDIQPNILCIEGPWANAEVRAKDRGGYEIPNDKEYIWRDCVDLALQVIQHFGRGRTMHFFFDSPQALIFPIAYGLRGTFPYRVYNLNRNAHSEKRYECVYAGKSS